MTVARRRYKFILVLLLANLALPMVVLFLVEGFSSYVLFAREVLRHSLRSMQEHTRYDPELGWVGIPNLNIPNMYGPGIDLRTNSRGFRNAEEVEPRRLPGRRRIVCSGDSVTLGQRVGNDQTWCSLLASAERGLESVNMGQIGYGVDQAYLWYLRDADDLEVDVHILAFITHDFLRMQHSKFIGFGRPVLRLTGGRLEVTNTPVPRRAYYVPWLTMMSTRLQMLKTVDLAYKAKKRLLPEVADAGETSDESSPEEVRAVVAALFAELKRYNDQRSRKTVLLYLPSLRELEGSEQSGEGWMSFVADRAAVLRIPLIDIVANLAELAANDGRAMYVDGYHLSEAGNERVAAAVLARLESDPGLADALGLEASLGADP
jgi:lysophospholipase L1-like esterase